MRSVQGEADRLLSVRCGLSLRFQSGSWPAGKLSAHVDYDVRSRPIFNRVAGRPSAR
jgi:hypothetical protein